MSESTQDQSLEPESPRWELPEDSNIPSERSFSFARVLAAVGTAMLVIAPSMYVLGSRGYFDESGHGGTCAQGSGARAMDAFDLDNATVPLDEIRGGGPPKDGIPAITDPKMLAADEADFLQPTDRVIGVTLGDEACAYPIAILNYHEIVNDRIADRPIAVSYCPLCDSVTAFDRNTSEGEREFGVSGLLYNSNVLMYDRDEKSESLWSQLKNESIAGKQVGNQLELLPVELTTWAEWKARHPSTTVMSSDTGHERDYARSPYESYFKSDNLMFPVDVTDDRLPPKERVLGVLVGETSRAYATSSFSDAATQLDDVIDGKRVTIELNPDAQTLRVADADDGVTWMYSLWFSWYAMHPNTELYSNE